MLRDDEGVEGMAIAEVEADRIPVTEHERTALGAQRQPRDLQRTFRLILATIWLLDAALQLQPFMFTRGRNGFSGMLNGFAAGNPGWFHQVVTWNVSIVYHQPILTDAIFAGVPVPDRLRDRLQADL